MESICDTVSYEWKMSYIHSMLLFFVEDCLVRNKSLAYVMCTLVGS